MHSVLDASIPVWALKLCIQINEKQLRENITYSNLRKQNFRCKFIWFYMFHYVFTSYFQLASLYIFIDFDVF